MKNRITLLFMILSFVTATYAQQDRNTKLIRLDEFSKNQLTEAKTLIKEALKMSSDDDLLKIKSETDQLGFTHEKYQQYFQGIKVEFATYMVHARNGKIETMNGEFFSIGKLNINPSVSNTNALEKAISSIGAEHYLWDSVEEAKMMDNYRKPEGELLVLPAKIFKGDRARLVYKFDIYATQPLSRADVYVDAHTGEVIFENDKIHHVDSSATGTSLYNGTVSFTADLTSNTYSLESSGIETYDMNEGTNYNNAASVTSSSSNFSGAATAVQAHWGAEQTHDYFSVKHSRDSYNNNGAVIRSYVSYDSNYVNAFWNGSVMTYGDGDGTNYGPLVSLDIVGHEIAHGVTEYAADLTYSYESGALNESFSDIFGESIEFYAQGSNDWLMGDHIGAGGSGGALRSMSNPNLYSQPDTYLGTSWYTGSGDNGGVHYNSGVQNFWFYLLSTGGSGTNDNGDSYNVSQIGMDKAAAVAYRNLTVYLTASSQYADARTGAIQAAIDLYGSGSAEEIAVTNAWYAVGVGAEYVQTCALGAPNNFASSSINDNGFSLSWSSVSGASSYTVSIGGSSTTVSGTSYTVTGLTEGTSYTCSVVANCSVGGNGTASSLNVTTTGTAPLVYCDSNGNSVSDEYIGRVQLGSIDNQTGGSSGGYSDYTSISTSLTKGSSSTIIITPIWTGTLYNEGYSVWIDYNKDGDFEDSGEQVWSAAASQNTPVSGSFTVPNSATNGATRMRVSMKYNGIPSPCETFSYGEVEDYTVNLSTGTSDTTAPVITLTGASTINLEVGDAYNELGATATDNVDGNLTSSIVITGTVNTNSAGTYTKYYNVSDASGNAANQVTRTINVTQPADTTAPVITLTGASTINLEVGDAYTELGATATDNVDGDLTSSIVITGTVNTSSAGTYTKYYNVSDAAGNAATQRTRSIIVTEPSTGSGCTSGVSSFPYSQSFENTIGAWTQATGDDFNWATRSGTTPSSNTGPSSADTGSYYIYMESSSPNYSTKQAILNSPCYDLSSESQATFAFKYHMYGASSMGSLALELSDDDGASWTSIWSASGNQGNSWLTASVNLAAYAGTSVQLRFNGVTGTTWQGDMAIDAVSLSTGGGSGSTCSDVSLSITFDNYPEETAWSIVNASGSTIASGGTYGSQADGSTLTIDVGCLDDGCYDFIITDTYGDGICCSYGNGSYSLTNSDTGVVLASGGSFTSSETTNFCLGNANAYFGISTSTITENTNQYFNVHPNPTNGILNVDLVGYEAQTYEILNMLGQVVAKGRYTAAIDVSRFENGVYILQLNIGEKKQLKRFIKE